MNFQAIARILSFVTLAIAVAFLVCGGTDVIWFQNSSLLKPWLHCLAITLLSATILFILSVRGKLEIFRREALAIVGLSWIWVCILGSLPYIILSHLSWDDALFEATSGITTTGLSIIPDLGKLSPGILLWRALSQWIGGLGIAVFFAMVTASMGTAAKQVFSSESSCNIADFDAGKMAYNARSLTNVYLALTAFCFLSHWIFGMSLYEALCHTLSTISTGGFSIYNEGFNVTSPLLKFLTACFMVLGGTNFLFFLRFRDKKRVFFAEQEEIKIYGIILFVATLLVTGNLILHCHQPLGRSLRDSFFEVASAMTSCGLGTNNGPFYWPSFTQMFLLFLTICGGCRGSTAGGIKVARIAIAYKEIRSTLFSYFRPQRIRNLYFNQQIIDDQDQKSIAHFCLLFFALGIFFVLLLLFLEPQLTLTSAGETVLALLTNSGLFFSSKGIDFSQLQEVTKFLALFIMLLGRLEFYAILILFIPSFWNKY